MKQNSNTDTQKTNAALERLKELYALYGCAEVPIPLLIPQKQTYDALAEEGDPFVKLIDNHGAVQLLRPDATMQVLHMLSRDGRNVPDRVFYRTEIAKYTTEDIEEIWQTGVEFFNDPSRLCDAEVIRLAIQSLRALGIEDIRVDLGHSAFIDELLKEMPELGPEEIAQAHHCFSGKNSVDMKELFENANVSPALARIALATCALYGSFPDVIARARNLCVNDGMAFALSQIEELCSLLALLGESEAVSLDLSFSNRMDYYSGVIFKVYTNQARRTVINGGRYDRFASRLCPSVFNACGFGHHLDLTLPLANLACKSRDPVHLGVPPDLYNDAALLAVRLRQAGMTVILKSSKTLSIACGTDNYPSLETLAEALL